MGELEHIVAIVTGAAHGIGREHALRFAAEGAYVVVNDIADPAAVVAEIGTHGGRAVANRADVTTWQGAHELIRCAIDNFGDLHALVNNAGGGSTGLAAEITEDAWDHEITLNLKGMFCPTRAALSYWSTQRAHGHAVRGSIVNTTSGAGGGKVIGTAASVFGCASGSTCREGTDTSCRAISSSSID